MMDLKDSLYKYFKKYEPQLLTILINNETIKNKLNNSHNELINRQKDNKLAIDDKNLSIFINFYIIGKIDKDILLNSITKEEYEYLERNNQQSTNDSYHNKENSKKVFLENNEQKNLNYYMFQLSNGYFISGGGEYLTIYDQTFTQKIKKEQIQNNRIIEISSSDDMIEAIICSDDKISKIRIKNNGEISIEKIIDLGGIHYFEDGRNFYVCNNSGLFAFNNFSKNVRIKPWKKNSESFNGAIIINKDIIALTTNKNTLNGEGELIIYDTLNKREIFIINGYSFISSVNNMSLLPKSDENHKCLICACSEKQRNGFLLINFKIENRQIKKFDKKFIDTQQFEVSCFCPYIDKIEKSIIDNDINKIDYDCVLVGGFDNEQKRGFIKIYKLNSNNEEIILKNFDNHIFIGMKITCIIQSRNDGKIMIVCDNVLKIFEKISISVNDS